MSHHSRMGERHIPARGRTARGQPRGQPQHQPRDIFIRFPVRELSELLILLGELYLSSGLGLSLLYGLHSLLLSSRSGSGSSNKAVGEDTVSARDSGTIVVLAANRGGVDQGVVVCEGCVVN